MGVGVPGGVEVSTARAVLVILLGRRIDPSGVIVSAAGFVNPALSPNAAAIWPITRCNGVRSAVCPSRRTVNGDRPGAASRWLERQRGLPRVKVPAQCGRCRTLVTQVALARIADAADSERPRETGWAARSRQSTFAHLRRFHHIVKRFIAAVPSPRMLRTRSQETRHARTV
jgi:hypothetical protein